MLLDFSTLRPIVPDRRPPRCLPKVGRSISIMSRPLVPHIPGTHQRCRGADWARLGTADRRESDAHSFSPANPPGSLQRGEDFEHRRTWIWTSIYTTRHRTRPGMPDAPTNAAVFPLRGNFPLGSIFPAAHEKRRALKTNPIFCDLTRDMAGVTLVTPRNYFPGPGTLVRSLMKANST